MSDSDTNIVETLAEEFAERLRRGESPTIAEYADAHPEFADEIRDLFPSVQMIEQLAGRHEQQRVVHKSRTDNVTDPEQLGDYRILRRIGQGGMGIVYEAVHQTLERHVAVKMLPPHMAHGGRHVGRFVREAKAAARLHHTNIVPVFGVGQDDGTYFYVMQLIDGAGLDNVLSAVQTHSQSACNDGTTLAYTAPKKAEDSSIEIAALLLSKNGNPRTSQHESGSATTTESEGPTMSTPYFRHIADIGVKVARALQYAHEHGVLHRDIKPANILIDIHGDVWVTDFGLAKLVDSGSMTASGDFVGTLRYVAPESFKGQTSTSSDVYSLGLTLYELISLRPAFEDTSHSSLVRRIMDEEPAPLRSIIPNVPQDLETIIFKAIHKDPASRYESSADLAHDLERFIEDRPIKARRASSLERLMRWGRRNPILATLTTTSILLLVAVTVLSSYSYFQIRWAFNQVDTALGEARQSEGVAIAARKQAEANLRIALQAFDEISDNLASRELPRSIQIDLADETPTIPVSGLSTADAKLVKSLLKFYDAFRSNNEGEARVNMSTATLHQRIGDIYTRLGHYDESVEAYQRTLQSIPDSDTVAAATSDLVILRAKTLNSLGFAHMLGGQFLTSIETHEQALTHCERHKASESSEAFRFALAETLNHLVHAKITVFVHRHNRRGRPTQRQERFPLEEIAREHQRALAALMDLVSEFPANAEYQRALAQCHRNFLPIAWTNGDDKAALEFKAEAVTILRRLSAEYPDRPLYQFNLADTLAMTKHVDSGTPGALIQLDLHELQDSSRLARQLHEQYPTALEYSFLLANTHHKMATHYIAANNWAQAETHLHQAEDEFGSLVLSSPGNTLFQVELGRVRGKLGERFRVNGDLNEARRILTETINNHKTFRESRPQRREFSFLLHNLYSQLALTLDELGEELAASEARTNAERYRPRPRPAAPNDAA